MSHTTSSTNNQRIFGGRVKFPIIGRRFKKYWIHYLNLTCVFFTTDTTDGTFIFAYQLQCILPQIKFVMDKQIFQKYWARVFYYPIGMNIRKNYQYSEFLEDLVYQNINCGYLVSFYKICSLKDKWNATLTTLQHYYYFGKPIGDG